MPSRHVLCTCRICLASNPKGCLIPSSTRQIHREEDKTLQLEYSITKEQLDQFTDPNVDFALDPERNSILQTHDLDIAPKSLASFKTPSSRPDLIDGPVSRVQQDLLNIIQSIERKIDHFVEPPMLKFSNLSLDHEYCTQFTLDDPTNVGPFALDLKDRTTRLFHDFEASLIMQIRYLSEFDCHGQSSLQETQLRCAESATLLLQEIDAIKEKHWNQNKNAGHHDIPTGVSIVIRNAFTRTNSNSTVLTLVLYLCAALHLLFGLSERKCHFVLVMLRLILKEVFLMIDPNGSHDYQSIIDDIPTDIRTVLKRLDILPQLKHFVCCPDCCALYACENDENTPLKCTNKETSTSELCGATLQKEHTISGNVYSSPIRSYYYQDLPAFIGNLLRRPQMEDLLEKPLAKLKEPQPMLVNDIWDGQELRLFPGSDGRPFLIHQTDELRLVFSLTCDGFTPFPKKTGRANGSVGAIFMVCLNLPVETRYNMENLYLVGITPGPQAPSLTQLNHFLRPLVDQLEKFWKEGFYYTWTPKFPQIGRLVRGALIPIIADLHAIRPLGGFAAFSSHHFCTFCSLLLEDIEDADATGWPPLRTCAEHRRDAETWLHSETQDERDAIFKRTGLRYTELLRLPYWDPTRYTLYDTMHGWFLNVAENYINDILGLDATQNACGDGLFVSPRPKGISPSAQELSVILEKININSRYIPGLPPDGVPHLGLYMLCEHRGLRRAGTRLQLWSTLHQFYSENPELLRQDIMYQRAKRREKGSQDGDTPELKRGKARLLKVSKASEAQDVLYLEKLPKDALLQLCNLNGLKESGTKHSLAIELVNLALKHNESPQRAMVLGRPSVREIDRDITRTVIPSWMASGPSMLGARTTKLSLKADEWRVILLVRMVVTLPRLWSRQSPRHKLMLDHFVNLVEAIVVGGSNVIISNPMSLNVISTSEKYRQSYGRYLRGIVELYPTAKVNPNTHLAYHVGDLLDRFGPVYTWRCNVFEYFNGIIQDIPTNLRFGQLETTFMRTFCMASYFKGFIADQEIDRRMDQSAHENTTGETIGSLLRAMLETDRTMVDPLWKGNSPMYTNSALGPRESMDSQTNQLLADFMNSRRVPDGFRFGYSSDRGPNLIPLEPFVVRLAEIKYRKRLYRRAILNEAKDNRKVYHRDSYILVKFPELSEPVPCSIQDIYLHKSFSPDKDCLIRQILLLVRRYKNLNPQHVQYDHWRPYPFVMGRLYYDILKSNPEFIYPEDIVSHFAKTSFLSEEFPQIDQPCMHVLPLDWDEFRSSAIPLQQRQQHLTT